MSSATVIAVASDSVHNLSKPLRGEIRLIEGLGIEGDAHFGKTVQHLSRVKKDPTVPNLRQVHLIHAELFDDLARKGFSVSSGQVGENITTRGVDLLSLPRGACLMIGESAVVEITGLRNPCHQLNQIQPGLMKAVLDRDEDGNLIRLCGVMAVVIEGGVIRPTDTIEIVLPNKPHEPLLPV